MLFLQHHFSNERFVISNNCSYGEELIMNLESGEKYYFRVGEYYSKTGNGTIIITQLETKENNLCEDAIEVVESVPYNFDNTQTIIDDRYSPLAR